MESKEFDYQNMIFDYVDQVKELLSPEVWQNVLLNCSKNELFVLWFLYRHEEVNMTQIAEYIHVPLNTATGIISRMEKRKLILRNHSAEDKRVVTIALSEEGKKQFQTILDEVMVYAKRIFESFTSEEHQMVIGILNKVTTALKTRPEEKKELAENKKIKKIMIE